MPVTTADPVAERLFAFLTELALQVKPSLL